MNGLGHELRLTLRGLARRPGFTVAAIATLALGIGASTAIFSVAYGISMRPLPYHDPDRLVRVYEASPANGQLELTASFLRHSRVAAARKPSTCHAGRRSSTT